MIKIDLGYLQKTIRLLIDYYGVEKARKIVNENFEEIKKQAEE